MAMTDTSRPRLFESPRARRRFILHVVLATVALAALLVFLERWFPFLFVPEEARSFVAGFGVLAPVVLVVLQTLQVVIAPVPGQVLAVVAGYLFGPWWGTVYNVVGITIGSAIAFVLARRFGRAYVERIAHPDAIRRFDGVQGRHMLAVLFLLFLIPGLPDDVLCFVGGLTRIPLWKLILVAAIGRTPAFFLANVFGGFVGTGDVLPAIIVAAFILILSLGGYLLRNRIFEWLTRG